MNLPLQNNTSLANLRWPTRPQAIGSHYFHTYNVRRSAYLVFPGLDVSVVACFCFWDGRKYVRTPCVKIMTTYSAVGAWWVNISLHHSSDNKWATHNEVNLNCDTKWLQFLNSVNVICIPQAFSSIWVNWCGTKSCKFSDPPGPAA